MTPTEQDKVEKYRSLLMKEHSNEWDMEKVSTIAHLCPTTEPIARKIANCKNPVCTTCPDNAITLADFITADRKRVALEARIDALEYAKISPKFKIEERIEALKQELESL